MTKKGGRNGDRLGVFFVGFFLLGDVWAVNVFIEKGETKKRKKARVEFILGCLH